MAGSLGRRRGSREHFLTWTASILCVVLTVAYHVAVHFRGAGIESIGLMGYRPVQDIWDGSYGALFTSVFVHGNPNSLLSTVLHLGFNLLYLFVLSSLLEETLSPVAWVMFFVGASVVSSGTEIALSSRAGVGVSGVVYAMFGLLWAGRNRYPEWRIVATKKNLNVMVGWGLFCVAATWLQLLHIANAAHFGGLAFGLATGWLLVGRRPWLSVAVLAALLALTVASVCWMPWSLPWVEWKANHERALGRYASAIRWYRVSLQRGASPEMAWSNILVTEHLRRNPQGEREAEAQLEKLGLAPPSAPFSYRLGFPLSTPGLGQPQSSAEPTPFVWWPAPSAGATSPGGPAPRSPR
jgi:GlpG protein